MNKSIQLFPEDKVVGVFRGFQQGGMEFHADLVLPYRNEYQNIPMHGQFLLVQLETSDEGALGRITSFSSEGKLSSGAGEEYSLRAVRENRDVPEDLREQYLKYRVNIRVLGVVRKKGAGLTFVPSHRRLPHVGSKVAFLSDTALREIAGHNIDGAPIGHLAFGEYIYAAGDARLEAAAEEWMQLLAPEILVKFPLKSLVARRSFIFARAGFGKSNLNKLLFSKLYEETPCVEKRGGRMAPVGTVIFDPDGEYFWPDDKGRPGLCDVPALEDKLVVFTERKSPSAFYQSFVAGGIRLDIRRFNASDVISIALSPERQEQQNVRKLRGLPQDRWERLVDMIDVNRNSTPIPDVCRLMDLDPQRQEAEAIAARSNMTAIVQMLHDKSSQLIDKLIHALSKGKLCVVDISLMRGRQSLILSGLILRRIFDRNQEEFTKADSKTIPTIAVVEEAQSVLNDRATAAEPYIAWVKEGRKYDLGALLITQQPGSIPAEILSQGDNWFIFHLLSETDLYSLKKANAHFSGDLLGSMLNEPIPGQGVFWSSVGGKPYPVSIRALSFEGMFPARDLEYHQPAGNTFAKSLRGIIDDNEKTDQPAGASDANQPRSGTEEPSEGRDLIATIRSQAIEALRSNKQKMKCLESPDGVPWGGLNNFFLDVIPEHLDDREQFAYRLVVVSMNAIFGEQDKEWESFKNQKGVTYVRKKT